MRFKLYYGFDPDNEKRSLYLWDYHKRRMVCKLLCNPFAKQFFPKTKPKETR